MTGQGGLYRRTLQSLLCHGYRSVLVTVPLLTINNNNNSNNNLIITC